MNASLIVLSTAAGAAAGPWLRACIFAHHVAEGRPRRTRCPRCRHPVGYGWQRRLPVTGRCPSCSQRLGAPLLAVEATTAAALAVVAWRSSTPLQLGLLGGLALVNVLLSFIDLGVRRLPNPIVLTTAATIATLAVASATSDNQWRRLVAAGVSAAVCGGFYLLLALLLPDSIGLGDIKWAAVLALVTGWYGVPALVALVASSAIAAVTTTALLALRLVHRHQAVPFGPFLSAGALTALALHAL